MAHHASSIRETALLIRQIKGAPATILLMMLGIGRPTDRNELSLLTTYSEHTVQRSLEQLQFLGFAQQHTCTNGWALTTAVRQLSLAFVTPASEPDVNPTEPQSCEVQNSHLDTAAARPAPAPAPEVRILHLDAPKSTGEVRNMHLASSSSCLKDFSPLRGISKQQPPTAVIPATDVVAASPADTPVAAPGSTRRPRRPGPTALLPHSTPYPSASPKGPSQSAWSTLLASTAPNQTHPNRVPSSDPAILPFGTTTPISTKSRQTPSNSSPTPAAHSTPPPAMAPAAPIQPP